MSFIGTILGWCKTHGLTLALYLAVGCVVYGQLEGWSTLDSIYFMAVTSTTVGYGDFCPSLPLSKLFTCVWALVGITVIISAIAPIVEWALAQRKHMEKAADAALKAAAKPMPVAVEDASPAEAPATEAPKSKGWKFGKRSNGSASETEAEEAPPEETDEEAAIEDDLQTAKKKISYKRLYFRALTGPIIIFCVGILLGLFVMGFDFVDSLYWTVITMTTVGYGDFGPMAADEAKQTTAKIVALVYLPLAVTALADALSEIAKIQTRKAIRETDYASVVDHLLLEEAQGDPEETLTEAEFLVSVLKSHDIIDDSTLVTIRQQFAHIVRHNNYGKTDDKKLTAETVFLEMVELGKVVDREAKTPPGTVEDGIAYVEFDCKDKGYSEWYNYHWLPRVYGNDTTVDLKKLYKEKPGAAAAAAVEKTRSKGGAVVGKIKGFSPRAKKGELM